VRRRDETLGRYRAPRVDRRGDTVRPNLGSRKRGQSPRSSFRQINAHQQDAASKIRADDDASSGQQVCVDEDRYKSPPVIVSRSRGSALAWPGIACSGWSWEMLELRNKLDKISWALRWLGRFGSGAPSWRFHQCSLQDMSTAFWQTAIGIFTGICCRPQNTQHCVPYCTCWLYRVRLGKYIGPGTAAAKRRRFDPQHSLLHWRTGSHGDSRCLFQPDFNTW
jgi:hypothetical protein